MDLSASPAPEPARPVRRGGRAHVTRLLLLALLASALLPIAGTATAKRPEVLQAPGAVTAGSSTSLTFDPWDNRRCTVRLAGPRRARSGPFTRAIAGGLARLSWVIPRDASRGRWQVRIACTTGKKRTTARRSIVVRGQASAAARGPLVARGSLRWTRKPIPGARAGRGPTDVADGRGAGGNPFEPRWCTWQAYESRPDIYERAVAKGISRSGWNGYQWAAKARAAGFPVGTVPVAGAIAVFSREYYGGPRRDERGGQYGHVAYVTRINGNGTFDVVERNGSLPARTKTGTRALRTGIEFIYGGPAGAGPGSSAPTGGGNVPPAVSDRFMHVVTLSAGGEQIETWWRPGEPIGRSNLGTTPGAKAISSFLTPDRVHHVAALGPGGELIETWWRPGEPIGRSNLGTIPGAKAISSFATADGVQHIVTLGPNGELVETWWRPGEPIGRSNLGTIPGAKAISSFATTDGVQHIVTLGPNGELVETWWRPGEPIGRSNLGTIPGAVDLASFAS